jgi:succinoglycan biosynthesis protein ExoM
MTGAPVEAALTLTVAIPTFRRPADLAELLPMLVAELAELSRGPDGPPVHARVLVVDNDPDGSAAPVVAGFDRALVRYVLEPQPGIAAARNRACEESKDADLLVFIDDDERPQGGWAANLLGTWRAHDVAAVTGPVVTEFDRPLDPWLAAGGIFDRWHRSSTRTGTELSDAATNNLLLDLRRVRALGLRFDVDLGLSGGEDSLFTRRLVAAGERIVWCAEAAVVERVRPERVNRRWMMMRAFSYGTIDCRVERALADRRAARLATRVRCVARGISRVGYGGARAALGLLVGSLQHQALGAQTMMRGAGLVLGSLGYTHQRYRQGRA